MIGYVQDWVFRNFRCHLTESGGTLGELLLKSVTLLIRALIRSDKFYTGLQICAGGGLQEPQMPPGEARGHPVTALASKCHIFNKGFNKKWLVLQRPADLCWRGSSETRRWFLSLYMFSYFLINFKVLPRLPPPLKLQTLALGAYIFQQPGWEQFLHWLTGGLHLVL